MPIELDPISRIEGHLGATLTTGGSGITDVEVHGNLWRGFENFLIGREPNDAITFTQRICGVCPVPHGRTSTHATEAAIGYSGTKQFQTPDMAANGGVGVPVKAIHIRNLVLGAEFLMSSLTHFYHLVAPSYIQGPAIPPWTPYFADSYYHPALQSISKGLAGGHALLGNMPGPLSGNGVVPLNSNGFSADVWSAVIKQYVKALRIRRITLEAGALFAGRMPMTSCYVAGGVTTYKDEVLAAKCSKFSAIMSEVGDFIVKEYIPVVLALGYLYPEFDNKNNVRAADSVTGKGYGAGCANFLAWGGFPKAGTAMDAEGRTGNTFQRGYVFNAGGNYGTHTTGNIVAADIATELVEHTYHSRYAQLTGYGYEATSGTSTPFTASRTVPDREKATAYSYLKAPRYKGKPCEVGPLARLVVMDLYPVDGTASLAANGGNALQQAAWDTYVKVSADTGTGLNPTNIEPDLAVALVRANLADLVVKADVSGLAPSAPTGVFVWSVCSGTGVDISGAGTIASPYYVGIDFAELSTADVVTAYGLSNAVIKGAITDWIVAMKLGLSTMDRIRARALESLLLHGWIGGWTTALTTATGGTYNYVATTTAQSTGIGAAEAPRGALMHICTINNKKIERYQCIVPTTWNASPKDVDGVKGPMEQAIVPTNTSGPQTALTPYSTAGGKLQTLTTAGARTDAFTATGGGVEALRIAQSFDPCIACAVH